MKVQKVDWVGNGASIAGGAAAEIVMNLIDTKAMPAIVSQFPSLAGVKDLSPILVGLLATGAQFFSPKSGKLDMTDDFLKGVNTIAAVEILRSRGVIKGITEHLGDIVPNIYNRQVASPQKVTYS